MIIIITKLLLFGNEKLKGLLKTNPYWRLQLSSRDLKPHHLITSLTEWYLKLTVIFRGYPKLAGKVSEEHELSNLYQFTSTV